MMKAAWVLFAVWVLVPIPLLGAEEVKIIGRDFSFDTPAILGAGVTTFTFENPGQLRHEMIIVLLRPGVTEQQVREAHQAGIPLTRQREQFWDGEILGILLAMPGQSSSGKLVVNLMRGRTYLILCQLEAPVGAPRHNILGMYATFRTE
jgi:hypothetical protein